MSERIPATSSLTPYLWVLRLCAEGFTGHLSCGEANLAFRGGRLLRAGSSRPTPESLQEELSLAPANSPFLVYRKELSGEGVSPLPLVLTLLQPSEVTKWQRQSLTQTQLVLRIAEPLFEAELSQWLGQLPTRVHSVASLDPSKVIAAVRAGVAFISPASTLAPHYLASDALDEAGLAMLAEALHTRLGAPHSAAHLLRHALSTEPTPSTPWCLELAELCCTLGSPHESISWFERSDAVSPSILRSWARAVLTSEDADALGRWFDAATPLFASDPSIRSLGFELARWMAAPRLARVALGADTASNGPPESLWAEAIQIWPDDPDVAERYSEALIAVGRYRAATLVLTEAMARIDDGADRARLALLAAQTAGECGWSFWQSTMLFYARYQVPSLTLGDEEWEALLERGLKDASPEGYQQLAHEASRHERSDDSSGPLGVDEAEVCCGCLRDDPDDSDALHRLLSLSANSTAHAERVADTLEHLSRRYLGNSPAQAARFLKPLIDLTADTLQQPQRALWAARHVGDERADSLQTRAQIRERVLDRMAASHGMQREVAALWRRSPEHYRDALAYYTAAAEESPSDTVALRSLERLYWILGEESEAQNALNRQMDMCRLARDRALLERRARLRAPRETQRAPAAAWDRLADACTRTHDAIAILDETMPHDDIGRSWLDLITRIQRDPSLADLKAWRRHFGTCSIYFRRAIDLAFRDGDVESAITLSNEWVRRHPWDLAAHRQRLLYALEQPSPDRVKAAFLALCECPLFAELTPEALRAIELYPELIREACQVIGPKVWGRLDLGMQRTPAGQEAREWTTGPTDEHAHSQHLHTLAESYRQMDQAEKEAWALQQLCLLPEDIDPSWLAPTGHQITREEASL